MGLVFQVLLPNFRASYIKPLVLREGLEMSGISIEAHQTGAPPRGSGRRSNSSSRSARVMSSERCGGSVWTGWTLSACGVLLCGAANITAPAANQEVRPE